MDTLGTAVSLGKEVPFIERSIYTQLHVVGTCVVSVREVVRCGECPLMEVPPVEPPLMDTPYNGQPLFNGHCICSNYMCTLKTPLY